MKKVLSLALLVAAGAFIMSVVGCGPIPVVPTPTGFTGVATDDGAGVKLSWNTVTVEGEDVTYTVSFEDTELLDEITATEYIDTDPGKAGKYEIIAVAGGEESDPAEFSTEPITIETKSAWELNGQGNSGITFNVIGKTIDLYSMAVTSNDLDKVDCYFSNWEAGTTEFPGPYYLASPSEIVDDPGKLDYDFDAWRVTGISNALEGDIEAIDTVPGTKAQTGEENYFNVTEVTINSAYAVSNQDDYFGIIEVTNIDDATGEVSFKATFQPIQGLRLF
ncbi:hypothetical protein CEE36_05735 [candidate division TA06 bacterium B3_TA06]|uniref:Uncharacterized protein n=1 Tax=candidate division TA06 bacterium B3_TA06 TaxID=2012487 RepID=A0A532V709_UNCT6|nr:MAG: hypothetical protein CEE36_05735 [candidate division TA06 bacterium B3_TA06]